MAIAFDATSTLQSGAGTSLTWAHTCTGSDRLLAVNATVATVGSYTVTGVTYNSVALADIGSATTTQPFTVKLWALAGPSTGSNNVVITSSTSKDLIGGSSSYTGCKQTGLPDDVDGAAFATTNMVQATTTTVDNCWIVGVFGGNRNITAGANTTFRAAASAYALCDSNSAQTPAGSHSLECIQSDGATACFVVASFAPAVAAGPANVKTWDSLTLASVKTVNSLAIASVKTINGLN